MKTEPCAIDAFWLQRRVGVCVANTEIKIIALLTSGWGKLAKKSNIHCYIKLQVDGVFRNLHAPDLLVC
ncbi:hypothetical protein NDU88_003817 [Pleurodeles waltl]|uniref:Uncharacterized protein n=1 Tax=Pleurodeles waltl TaxID=8319 RepID=A0AAV7LP71_PLEWA|nr:hypothetical protein NDU88_003817 [Pleurodeles waltl]